MSFFSFLFPLEYWNKNHFNQQAHRAESGFHIDLFTLDQQIQNKFFDLFVSKIPLNKTSPCRAENTTLKTHPSNTKIGLFLMSPKNFLTLFFLKTESSKIGGSSQGTNVPWNYKVDVKLPHSLKGKTPGKIPDYLLKEIQPYGKLHIRAANAWHAMRSAAKVDGINLKPTSAGDCYRSLSSQTAAFKVRFVPAPPDDNIVAKPYVTRTFENKTWYLKKGYAPLASPGTSNHNLGLAVDIFSASQPERMRWLINNVAKFGFSWELIPAEPWHIRYWAGDDIPQAVQDWISNNPTLAYQDSENPESHDQNLGNH